MEIFHTDTLFNFHIKELFIVRFPCFANITVVLANLLHACDGVMFDTTRSKVFNIRNALLVVTNVRQMTPLPGMQFLVRLSNILISTLLARDTIYHIAALAG